MELDVTDNSGLSAHASKRAKNNAVGIGKVMLCICVSVEAKLDALVALF